MNEISVAISVIGFLCSISSIVFAYLALKRNEKNDTKIDGERFGLIQADIKYIVKTLSTLEEKFIMLDNIDREMLEREVDPYLMLLEAYCESDERAKFKLMYKLASYFEEEILEEIQFKTILVEKKEETENVSEIVQEIEDKSESTDIEEAEREVTTTEETEYENETVVTEERIYVSTLEL